MQASLRQSLEHRESWRIRLLKEERKVGEFKQACRRGMFELDLAQERLSRLVVDLVLEWKRNKSKE